MTNNHPLQANPLLQTVPHVVFNPLPVWSSPTNHDTWSVAWGDMNGDGLLDLAIEDQVYLNQSGMLQATPAWSAPADQHGSIVAWGDMNGDGALDLAVGNKVYLNQGGMLQATPAWSADTGGFVAWGDMNGDGALDLAIGNKVYLNQGGMLQATPVWSAPTTDAIASVAWGDMNGDGLLDLAVGNHGQPSKVYLNQGGMLQTTPAWSTLTNDEATDLAWGDMNGDGLLDLAVSNYGDEVKVYLNKSGLLQVTPVWSSPSNTYSVAWGDVNSDGYLDLIAGDKIYVNQGGTLQAAPAWSAAESNGDSYALSSALGDINGDSTLDLVVTSMIDNDDGHWSKPTKVYLNQESLLQTTPAWSAEVYGANTAWGDMNNDGALDFATSGEVYLNQGGILQTTPVWSVPTFNSGVAWGDMNGDGLLDLTTDLVGGVYLNQNDLLQTTPTWSTTYEYEVPSVAWGDMNGDGLLDLAIGEEMLVDPCCDRPPPLVYLNQSGMLQTTPAWSAPRADWTRSVAWGDMNGDGLLDLAVGGNYRGQPTKVYLNQGGMLQTTPAWSPLTNDDDTNSVAWGDMNGDGLLDLAMGNYGQPSKVYLNQGGMLQTTPAWLSPTGDNTKSIAWGDMNGDGLLDLAVGNYGQPSKVYLNQGGMLQTTPAWSTPTNDNVKSVAWGDMNNDGAIDLAVGNKVYLNERSTHSFHTRPEAITLSSISDPVFTQNGGLTRALDPANFYALSVIRQSGRIPITYNLFHPSSQPIGTVRAYYSLDGSFPPDRTQWRVAKPLPGTQLTDLSTSPFPTTTVASTHVFNWDVFGSGFFGESDNVVVRLEALPNLKPRPNSVPGPFQRPFVSSQTFPFRVRGTQVRVLQAGNPAQPLNNALVYHLPASQNHDGQPFKDQRGVAFQTNGQGYLQGYGSLQTGDKLVALSPITYTSSYTVYQTSATPVLTGLDAYTVSSLGVQTLTVSAANPLILFNLTVSLEWDARNDPLFMQQLQNNLQLTSRFLYDLTNGQVALGNVTIYHQQQHWRDADVRIYATNQLRPHASIGGIVDGLEIENTPPQIVNGVPVTGTLLYAPGQVEIGAIWNRYGEASDNLGEDWSRTLAHELGHYLFFLNDNYLGLNGNRVIAVDGCPGMMSNPYFDQESEFHPQLNWQPECAATFSNQMLGHSDWETITKHYPWLHAPPGAINNPTEAGPNALILAVTQIHVADIITAPTTLVEPTFFLTKRDGSHYAPSDGARDLLFQGDQLVDLGAPHDDQVKARGARPGDELCIYDLAQKPDPLSKCQTVQQSGEQLLLAAQPNWQPDVTITPLTSHTISIRVAGVTANALNVRIYPEDAPAPPPVALTYDSAHNQFVGAITLAKRTLAAHLHIYAPNDRGRGIVTDYTLGSGSDLVLRDGETLRMSHGRTLILQDGSTIELSEGDTLEMTEDGLTLRMSHGRTLVLQEGDTLRFADGQTLRMSHGRTLRMSHGRTHVLREGDAPITSSDGQMTLFGDQIDIAPGEYYILQPATALPSPPAWATLVGQAYQLTASPGAQNLQGASITFNYLGRDIAADKEKLLRIAFWNGSGWQALTTTVDQQHNIAYATAQGLGIYMLMYSIDIPLAGPGWNQFGYSIPDTKPIALALSSLDGKYNTVYSYDAFAPNPLQRWQVYAPPPTPTWVNTLTELTYNHAYWIHVTANQNLTLQLADVKAAQVTMPTPPALYYGTVLPTDAFIPTAGMQVRAWIGDTLCGESVTRAEIGQIVYTLIVAAAGSDGAANCGAAGQIVRFAVGSGPLTTMANRIGWDNSQLWNVALSPLAQTSIYLPIIKR